MIRVLVLASSPIARAGLEAVLREDSRFAVLADGGLAPAARAARADVLLIEAAPADPPARFLPSLRNYAAPVVLLADHLRRADLRRALHSGTRAILPRDAAGAEIIAAVEAAAAGLIVLSGEDLDTLLPADTEIVSAQAAPGEALSPRELEVLAMLAEGLVNKEIATRLRISEHTVKFHVSSILGKLGAGTRGEAVARGVREGLVVI